MIETNFKETELGPIPEDWEFGKFVDFLNTFSAGATPFRGISSYFVGNIPWITSGELNFNRITDTIEHISLEGQKKTHLTIYPKGTFLIAITGLEAVGTRGRCAFVETPATTNQSCLAITSSDKMHVNYLFWFYRLWSDYLAFNFSQGSKQQSFTADIAKKLPIYRPPLTEQLRIAEVLSDVDALIAEMEALIQKKQAIMTATMQDLLTARRRLPGFSEPWKSMTFEGIGTLIRGVGFSPEQSSQKYKRGSMPLLRANNIKNDSLIFDELIYVSNDCVKQTQILKDSDILICTANGSSNLVGKSVIIPKIENYTFGAFMTILRCHDMRIAKYLIHFMRSSSYRKQIMDLLCGSAINNLNSRQLYKINVPCPSNIDEINEIAKVLSDMNDEIEEIVAKRNKYIAIRQGMMQQLLTGKIRLT